MQKSMFFFDGSEPRLALYSSLVSHFGNFCKKLKSVCKKGSQKCCFLVQIRAVGATGSIDSAIFDVLEVFEKSMFF